MPGNKKVTSYKLQVTSSARRGFTIIEMLVVVALFAMLGVVIVNVYLLALSAQRQTAARQNTTANLRYVMEVIARQIRTGEIDYAQQYSGDGTPGIQGSEQELYLNDADGNSYAYFVQGGELKLSYNGDQASALTSTADVSIVSLAFYIDPPTDPFAEERCNDAAAPTGCLLTAQPALVCSVDDNTIPNERPGFCQCTANSQCATQYCDIGGTNFCLPLNRQPRVTIVLGFESTAVNRGIERKRLYVQTTVASRTYKR